MSDADIIHSSATPFDTDDPAWRTYCGLTADQVANLVINRDSAGNTHTWRPDGQMTCRFCRAVALPSSWLNVSQLEEWLAT